jgi:hypothetical protein
MYSDYGPSAGRGSAGTSETMSPPVRGAPGTSETVKPTRQQNKPEAAVPRLRDTGPDRSSLINKPSLDKNYSNEGRGKPAPAAPTKPSMDIPKMRDDAKAALDEDPSALMMGGGAAAAAAAALLAKTKLGKFGKLFKGAKASDAKRLERPGTVTGKDFLVRDYEGAAKAGSKGAPKKQLGYSKDTDVSDVTPKTKNWRSEVDSSKREDGKAAEAYERLKELAGKKRGGAVKKYASGGMVSSASKRADGIASKGKTRCKIC